MLTLALLINWDTTYREQVQRRSKFSCHRPTLYSHVPKPTSPQISQVFMCAKKVSTYITAHLLFNA